MAGSAEAKPATALENYVIRERHLSIAPKPLQAGLNVGVQPPGLAPPLDAVSCVAMPMRRGQETSTLLVRSTSTSRAAV